ncbi:MMPL family transporter [Streptomyces rubiginosohelvolus]
MATLLYRLGRFCFRRRRAVALFWVALLTVAGIGAASANTAGDDSFSIPGIEAQKAFDLLEQRFPEMNADGAQANIVFRAPEGHTITSSGNQAAVTAAVTELGSGSDQVAHVTDPYTTGAVSKDASTAYISITYKVQPTELTEASKHTLDTVLEGGRDAGLTVEVGGTATYEAEAGGGTEAIGILIAGIVLAVTFGSLVAAGLPLLTAIIGVGIGVCAITTLTGVLGLSGDAAGLASMLGLAVGIDYALFIVSRYRGELVQGMQNEEAAGRAVGTAGSAVVFAGLAVVIALAGLTVVRIPVLTEMGLAAAGTVAVAVVIALTLIPAMLGFAGDKIFSRKDRRKGPAPAGPSMGTRWARFVLRRPVAVLITATAGLALIAVPAASLELGLPGDGQKSTDTSPRRAYDLMAQGFGAGVNGPLLVTVDAGTDGDAKVQAEGVRKTLNGLTNIAAVTPAVFDRAGITAVQTVIPVTGPDTAETKSLLADIRDTTGEEVMVTGTTAMNVDFSDRLNDALVPYLLLVVGLAFLLLVLVFRSVLVPLKAALGFLLSVAASLGAVVAVFQWGWLADLIGVDQTGPIMSLMPIFLVGVVFGLAMDYEVFLVSRMREAHVHGANARQAIITGFDHGARVVTAAALIMISVFAGFIGSSDAMIKMMGFGLAVAVLFDAFIVRMTIVPAVLALLGGRAWNLHRWLDNIMPNVDVEGDQLHRQEPAEQSDNQRPAAV